MKKILLLVLAILTLLLIGCEDANKPENDESVGQNPIVDVTESHEVGTEANAISKLENVLKEVEESEMLNDEAQIERKRVGEVSLNRKEGFYVLEVTVNNAVSFDRETIDDTVKMLEDSEQDMIFLDSYRIYKKIPESLKAHLDFMKENNMVGIELDYWKDYGETNWLNEDKIPVFIEDENEIPFYVIKNVDENEPDKYYLLRMQIAGQSGLYSVPSDTSLERHSFSLNSNDTIEWRNYEVSMVDTELKETKTMTVEEFFNDKSSGEDSINIDERIRVENENLVLELYDGGN